MLSPILLKDTETEILTSAQMLSKLITFKQSSVKVQNDVFHGGHFKILESWANCF